MRRGKLDRGGSLGSAEVQSTSVADFEEEVVRELERGHGTVPKNGTGKQNKLNKIKSKADRSPGAW
jgi:hypothetical protein